MACVQEVRDAVNLFRSSGGSTAPDKDAAADDDKAGASVDGAKQEQQPHGSRKFSIAVADTFGEGSPVRVRLLAPNVFCEACLKWTATISPV